MKQNAAVEKYEREDKPSVIRVANYPIEVEFPRDLKADRGVNRGQVKHDGAIQPLVVVKQLALEPLLLLHEDCQPRRVLFAHLGLLGAG